MTFATRPDFGIVRAWAGLLEGVLLFQDSDEDMFLLRSPKR